MSKRVEIRYTRAEFAIYKSLKDVRACHVSLEYSHLFNLYLMKGIRILFVYPHHIKIFYND